MKQIIVLRGLPGSGKTTLANHILSANENDSDIIVLSTDDRITTPRGQYMWSGKYLHLSHSLNKEMCREAMNRQYGTIIIDNTNTTAREIKPYFDLAKEFGYQFSLLEPATKWKNNPVECAKKNKHGVSQKIIEKMLARYQTSQEVMERLNNDNQDIVE